MGWSRRLVWGVVSTLGFSGFASPGRAEEAGSESSNVLTEIVVTAQKREEKLQNVPIAITVVNAAQLANQHVYTIADLARTTPALEMVQAFGGPGGGGQIRGIGTQSFTRSAEGAVGIVVDGVPQGNVNITDIFDVQRVEVLRGPQGTLFGLTSSAGVINMVTAAPDPSKFEAKAHADYSDKGTAGSKYGQETLRGVVNIPLTEASALRISASGDRLNGVQRNDFTHEDNVAKDFSVRARYLLKASDSIELNVITDYDRRRQNYNDAQFTYISANPGLTAALAACGITPSYANQDRCGGRANDYDLKNYGASAQLDVDLAGITLTSISAYRKNQSGPSDADFQGLNSEFAQIFAVGATTAGRQFSQELRVTSPSAQKIEYVAGLFYSDYLASTGYAAGGGFKIGSFFLAPFFIPFAQDGTATETSNKSAAAFGQMTYHLTDELGLIAGARYTHQRITDHASANPYDPASLPVDGITSENNVSGRLGLQYKFNPDLTGYVTAVRGYKGPQVIPASQGVAAKVIAAEIPTSYELGLKGSALGGALGIDVNAFYTRVHDYQGQRCFISPVGALTCNGESIPSVTTKGVELDLFGRPVTGLSLNGGIIVDEAKYPDGWSGYDPNNLNGGTTNLGGKQLVGVPKTKFTLAGEYSRPVGNLEAFIGADTVYKSDLRLGPSGDPRFVYPSHWNTGARLGVRSGSGSWSAALFARNLSNEHEPVTIFGGPSFTPPGADPTAPNGYVNGISGWVAPTSLRQVGLSLDAKF
jgi:iron complex outermembrane recepter protein